VKKIILLIIICCFNLQAQPTGIISTLMDTPVNKFEYGMSECNNYLNREYSNISNFFQNINLEKKYGLLSARCDYNYSENEIELIFMIGEKSKNGIGLTGTDLENDECKQMMDILTNTFIWKYKKSGKDIIRNNIVDTFTSDYISTNLDKEVNLILKDYIFIYIAEILTGVRCKQKLDINEPVLFFQ